MGTQYTPFVITPGELKTALAPFMLLRDRSSAPADYVSTPADVIISDYTALYNKLCSGAMIDPSADGELLRYFSVTTDISSIVYKYSENYRGEFVKHEMYDHRGSKPSFVPFVFDAYEDNGKIFTSSGRDSWMVTYAGEIMGFQILFPKLSKSEIEHSGVKSEKEYETYSDYKLLRDYIMKITSALKFSMNGIEKKTQIRVSGEAKKMLGGFYCIKSRNITIL